jgi:hypothetical protein
VFTLSSPDGRTAAPLRVPAALAYAYAAAALAVTAYIGSRLIGRAGRALGRARNRKRERRRLKEAGVEVLPGLFSRVQGTGLVTENRMTPDQFERTLKELRAERPALERGISQAAARLRELVTTVPTAQLLVRVFDRLKRGVGQEFVQPYDVEFSRLEYITYLTLELPAPVVGDERIPAGTMEEAFDLLSIIATTTHRMLMFESEPGPEHRLSPETIANFRAQLHELAIRGPSYQLHLYPRLERLFASSSADLQRLVGVNDRTLLAAVRAIDEVRVRAAVQLLDWITPMIGWMTDDIARGNIDGVVAQGLDRETAERGRRLAPPEIRKLVDAELRGRMFSKAPLPLVTSPAEIAHMSGITEDDARTVLKQFSTGFGQARLPHDRLQRIEALRLRPLVEWPDDAFALFLGDEFLFAVQPNIESALRVEAEAWNVYQRARSSYLEERTFELFTKIFPGAQAERSLKYTFDDGQGEQEFELDLFVRWGNLVILSEQKAGGLPTFARGGGEGLRVVLERLIGAAHGQALRARRYLASTPEAHFHRGRDDIAIDTTNIEDTLLVTTTLEELQGFPAQLREVHDLGLLAADEYPWAVALGDLEAIAELIEWPAELVHYLRRRVPLNAAPVAILDELDLFGCYLQVGLEPGFLLDKADAIQIGNFASVLDPYFWVRYADFLGLPAGTVKPYRMEMPAKLRRRLEALALAEPVASLAESIRLLDEATASLAAAARKRILG